MPEITITQVDLLALFWATLTSMLPGLKTITVANVMGWVVVPCSGYVLVASACRLRFGTGTEISIAWAALYLCVAACAALLLLSAFEGQARLVDVLLSVTVAAYIHFTASSWSAGVPPVARPPQNSESPRP